MSNSELMWHRHWLMAGGWLEVEGMWKHELGQMQETQHGWVAQRYGDPDPHDHPIYDSPVDAALWVEDVGALRMRCIDTKRAGEVGAVTKGLWAALAVMACGWL